MPDGARTLVRGPELAGGLLRGRARFHLSYRTLVRLYGMLADDDLTDRWPAALASIAGDVGWFLVLRRDDGDHLLPRLVHDSLDVAYWSAVSSTDGDHPTLITVPLGIEAGARHGFRALAVPLAIAGAATAARAARGRRTPPMFLFWPTAAVLAGIATAANSRRQDAATIAEQAVRAEARVGAAYAAGQNAVAMGADSVVDLLTRTEPLIAVLEETLAEPGSSTTSGTAKALSAWKSDLATASAGQAAYLGTLLTRWQRARSAHDLTRDLVLDLPEGAGTALVSARQAEWLTRRLDQLRLEGRQTVAVPESIEPGSPFTLGVGHHLLEVPADPDPPVRGYEHAPVLLAAGAVWSAVAALRDNERAGWAVLPGVVGSLGLATWAHVRIRHRRPAVDHRLLTALVGVSALHGAVVSLHQRNTHDVRGLSLYPQFGGPTISLALLVAQRSPRRLDAQLLRALAVIVGAAMPGFAMMRLRRPIGVRSAVVASLNLWAWWACMWGADDDLEHHRQGLVQASREEAERREHEARAAGRETVRGIVRAAFADSCDRLAALTARLDRTRHEPADGDERTARRLEELRTEAVSRLNAAEKMLDELTTGA